MNATINIYDRHIKAHHSRSYGETTKTRIYSIYATADRNVPNETSKQPLAAQINIVINIHVVNVSTKAVPRGITFQLFQYPIYQPVQIYLVSTTTKTQQQIHRQQHNYFVHNNVLYYAKGGQQRRLVIPTGYTEAIIQEYHDMPWGEHFSTDKPRPGSHVSVSGTTCTPK